MAESNIPNVAAGEQITANKTNEIIDAVNQKVDLADVRRHSRFMLPNDRNVKNWRSPGDPNLFEVRLYPNKWRAEYEGQTPSQRVMRQWIYLESEATAKEYLTDIGIGADPDTFPSIRNFYYDGDNALAATQITDDNLQTGWFCLEWSNWPETEDEEEEEPTIAEAIYLHLVKVPHVGTSEEGEPDEYDVFITMNATLEDASVSKKIGAFRIIYSEPYGDNDPVGVKKWYNCLANVCGILSMGGAGGWVTNAPPDAYQTTNYSYDAKVSVLYFDSLT